jgi:hypothetical protein
MFGCIGLSYFFSWVIEVSGKRNFSGLIAHGAMNAFMLLFPPIIAELGVSQPRFWLSQIFIFVIGIIVVAMWIISSKNKF